jgi:hypothetical protein
MVTPRKFTATEWRDLARGCRALIHLDEEGIERNKATTVVGQFERSKAHHQELLELCEHWAGELERRR